MPKYRISPGHRRHFGLDSILPYLGAEPYDTDHEAIMQRRMSDKVRQSIRLSSLDARDDRVWWFGDDVAAGVMDIAAGVRSIWDK